MGAAVSDELQLDEATPPQHRLARPEALTWLVLLALMAAVAVGLFGRGPLSHATRESPSGQLSLEYQRFERYGAFMRLTVTAVARPTDSTVEIVLPSAYLEAVHLERIVPAPLRERSTAGGVAYQFALHGDGPLSVQFDLQPMRRGRIDGSVTAAGDVLRWWHFIYP